MATKTAQIIIGSPHPNCEKEFSSLPGHAVLRHNNNA